MLNCELFRIFAKNLFNYNTMANNLELIAQCEARAKEWLSPAFDDDTRKAQQ